MAKTGRLIYERTDGKETTVLWYAKDDGISTDYIDFCGSADPLTIKYSGERYGTIMPSSATVRVMVETLEQRQFLEGIFDGGYVMDISQDTNPLWAGFITPSLGRYEYKAYPYEIQLNANDGLAKTKKKKFLNTDFPEPWDKLTPDISVLDIIVKTIGITCRPENDYDLFISNVLKSKDTAIKVLERTKVDPLCFMDAEDDNYMTIDKVIDNLLGPLHMKLFVWKNNWYVMGFDAGYDQAHIPFEKYNVDDKGILTYVSDEVDLTGIVDLFTDCEMVKGSGSIEYIAPMLGAEITQDFQLNQNIFPAFANRTGSFYRGHDGTDLELGAAVLANRLRHWTANGLKVSGYKDEENEGSLNIPVTKLEGERQESAKIIVDIPNDIYFNSFFFSIDTVAALNGVPITNATQQGIGIKKIFNIKYINAFAGGNSPWTFWRNNPDEVNDPNSFDGWHDNTVERNYKFDTDKISIEAKMPDNSLFNGGTFEFSISNGYDNTYNETNNYSYYLKNFNFGIVSQQTDFKLMQAEQGRKPFFQREWVPIVGELLLSPMPLGIWTMYAAVKRRREKARKAAIGGVADGKYTVKDIDWQDTIRVDINPKGENVQTFNYVWGLHLKGTESHHELHISSAYTTAGKAESDWQPLWDASAWKDLLAIKSETLIRDNMEHTAVLSADFVTDKINPINIYSDFEGRVYKPYGLVYNDKTGVCKVNLIEYKALNLTGTVYKSFDLGSFDNSFSK